MDLAIEVGLAIEVAEAAEGEVVAHLEEAVGVEVGEGQGVVLERALEQKEDRRR